MTGELSECSSDTHSFHPEAPKYALSPSSTRSMGDEAPGVESIVDETERMSRSLTGSESLKTIARRRTTALPKMGGGRGYPPELPEKLQYVVAFEGSDDPMHPFNWTRKRKYGIFGALTFSVFTVAFGSSIFATAAEDLMKEFHVGSEVVVLGVSLYVLGFATGPIVWAPLSELYGRKPILIVSAVAFTLFQFAVATAKDLQTIMLCRFFGSCIGSAPLVVVGAAFADVFDNTQRGYALCLFALGVVIGPQTSPIIGGFISHSYLGWRWTEYITGIMGACYTILIIFVYEESHHPIILAHKAEELRRRTDNWGIRAAHEEFNLSFKEILENNVSRPMVLLVTEPIILLVTVYVSFVYGVLYLCLTAYPIIFAEGYKWTGGVVYLPYIAIVLGEVLGALWVLYCEKDYIRQVKANDGMPVPEARLVAMLPAAVIFPTGLLWLCISGYYYERVHWMAPTASGVFIGFGIFAIFLPSINYIVDSYLIYAASALAANTFIRSIFGAVFPLFGSYMFHGMNTKWAGVLLGLFGFAMAPVPLLFQKYGKRIRSKSKYAFDLKETKSEE